MDLAVKKAEGEEGYLLTRDDHIKRYVWLACWLLQGLVSADEWKDRVISKIRSPDKRVDVTKWMTSSDLAYLCLVYIHSYDKWKREAEMRIEKPSMIKLSDEDKKVLNKMGRYQPDGMSSEDGWNKFLSIQAHYGFQVVKHQASKEKFNRNFWLYYDENITPILQPDRMENSTTNQENTVEYQAMIAKEEQENKLVSELFSL